MSVVGKAAGKAAGLVGAQLALTPIQSQDPTATVEKALEIINAYPLTVETNAMSTLITGELDTILEMVKALYQTMNAEAQFTLDIRLSNTCGL
ncbi:YkoF family thiamine/hydroxymethylpyrimidine-binding protein [Acidaminobacter hydrogenoformans]|uniref:Thiamine-binding protein n=1 Tax=Acidaminobacter hydrogenoformans DSM 2784 TaxID=1120920 RepID=A0A1G5S1T7_9FIRM|nr:YkoF family thiamine/hydroxymethylpyrimidine-binding protein [Acidaminobacter hydrogenoformans]SCZ80097.1 Thiamine-binding protein [Acidaminobacter hydrogenoformans DSM 2784]